MINHCQIGLAAAALLACATAASAEAGDSKANPLSFFEGRTESVSTVKVVMKKAFRSRSIGRGKLLGDRSLDLIQRVEDEGQAPRERRWKIRQTAPGRFTGTMTEAIGPVVIDETPRGYRFRFKLKDNLAVEQWLMPAASGASARSETIVRKFGVKVARSEGTIRKI